MFELKKILLPIDFSESSVIAARQAAMLARHLHAELTLLHVAEIHVFHPLSGALGFGTASVESMRPELMTARRKQLDRFAATELPETPVKRIVCCGDPAEIIVNRAKEEQSGLILMPTHGSGSFRRFLLGSVTAKVLHDSECPVWTGAHLENASGISAGRVRNVMCAVNFGPQTGKTLRWAAGFAAEFGARLTLVNAVLHTPPNLPDRYAFQWHTEAHCGADERLRALLHDSGLTGDPLVVSDGNVPGALARAVEEKDADLLVIGRTSTEERGGRLGTHSYAIICRVPCPVVSI